MSDQYPGAPPPDYDQLVDTGQRDPVLASLSRLAVRLDAIERSEDRRAGSAQLLSRMWAVFGGSITAGAVALGVWVWTVQGDVAAVDARAARNAELIEDHRAAGGPVGHPDVARAATAEGRIAAVEVAVAQLGRGLEEQRVLLMEILDRLPRRRR